MRLRSHRSRPGSQQSHHGLHAARVVEELLGPISPVPPLVAPNPEFRPEPAQPVRRLRTGLVPGFRSGGARPAQDRTKAPLNASARSARASIHELFADCRKTLIRLSALRA